jgi:hypothetical protein
VKLWLDDLRPPPDEDWVWVKSVDDAISWMLTKTVTHASLDNDLGEDKPEGRKLVLWMAEYDTWPQESILVHLANPVAADYMAGMISRFSRCIVG